MKKLGKKIVAVGLGTAGLLSAGAWLALDLSQQKPTRPTILELAPSTDLLQEAKLCPPKGRIRENRLPPGSLQLSNRVPTRSQS